jgi:hypothetical protein
VAEWTNSLEDCGRYCAPAVVALALRGSGAYGRAICRLIEALISHPPRSLQVVVLDAPLLFETGLNRITNPIVCVSLPLETQLERLKARDGIDGSFAQSKIAAQMSTELKCSRSHHIVDNNGTREQTRAQVLRVVQLLHALRPGWWSRINVSVIVCVVLGAIWFGLRRTFLH